MEIFRRKKVCTVLDRKNTFEVFRGRTLSYPIPDEPRWKKPKRVYDRIRHLHRQNHSEEEKAATATVNWLTTISITDPIKTLYFEILGEILLGNPGAPLYKRLIESGIGRDISPVSGVETHLKQITFSAGLRGISPRDQKAFEAGPLLRPRAARRGRNTGRCDRRLPQQG